MNFKKIASLTIATFFSVNIVFSPVSDAGMFVTRKDEIKQGEIFQYQVENAYHVSEGQAQQNVAEVTTRLRRAIDNPRNYYDVKCIDAGFFNAFCGPNGKIYITRHMEKFTQMYDELAFVIAHEMGHDNYEHYLKRENDQGLALAGAVAVAALAGANENTIALSAIAAGTTLNRSYGFKFEKQADEFAFNTIIKAGYNPGAGAIFFHKLMILEQLVKRNSKSIGFDPQNFIYPHPKTDKRLATQIEYIEKYSNNRVKIKNDYVYVDGKLFVHPVSTKKADSYQRTYFMAGVLARLCHQNANINCEVRNKSLYVNNIFIMTQSNGDENLSNICRRMN